MNKEKFKQLVNFIAFLVMMFVIFVGIIASICFLAFIFGPKPSRFIIFCAVLPLTGTMLYIFTFLGMGVGMLLWKPFLTVEQAKEYFFEPVTPESEIPQLLNSLFIKPYYKLSFLIFPKVKEEFKRKHGVEVS
ncbi:MAG: hypothetical protein MUF05_00530 [Candidatus Omnitrophica bacterium]|jgi:hypothetical protein|nr:hypothetical protein [Candidatus Omnitrophota bacterium]